MVLHMGVNKNLWGISELPWVSVSKWGWEQSHWYENDFSYSHANKTHKKGFALSLVLKLSRVFGTWKWPINFSDPCTLNFLVFSQKRYWKCWACSEGSWITISVLNEHRCCVTKIYQNTNGATAFKLSESQNIKRTQGKNNTDSKGKRRHKWITWRRSLQLIAILVF